MNYEKFTTPKIPPGNIFGKPTLGSNPRNYSPSDLKNIEDKILKAAEKLELPGKIFI